MQDEHGQISFSGALDPRKMISSKKSRTFPFVFSPKNLIVEGKSRTFSDSRGLRISPLFPSWALESYRASYRVDLTGLPGTPSSPGK